MWGVAGCPGLQSQHHHMEEANRSQTREERVPGHTASPGTQAQCSSHRSLGRLWAPLHLSLEGARSPSCEPPHAPAWTCSSLPKTCHPSHQQTGCAHMSLTCAADWACRDGADLELTPSRLATPWGKQGGAASTLLGGHPGNVGLSTTRPSSTHRSQWSSVRPSPCGTRGRGQGGTRSSEPGLTVPLSHQTQLTKDQFRENTVQNFTSATGEQ